MATLAAIVLLMTSLLQTSLAVIEIPEEVPRPPRITKQPDDVTYAIPKSEIVLKCAANAFPNVADINGYSWTKNGEPLTVSREGSNAQLGAIVMSSNDGTIRFTGSQSYSEEELMQFVGVYQCFAANKYGTAITRPTTLKAASTPYVPPANKVLDVQDGDSITVPCNYSTTSDGYVTTWNFEPDTTSINERMTQTQDGALVIANVVGSEDDGLTFYCIVKDKMIRRSTDGPHYTLRVNTDEPPIDREPRIVSPSYSQPKIVLKGNEMKLICGAIGNPTPTIKWEKQSGRWPENRYDVTDSGKVVTITNVTYEETGDYKCVASNYLGKTTTEVSILVHSRPFFENVNDRPNDVIVVPGGDVTIRCKPEGIPQPTTEWRVNGKPIRETSMSNREVFANQILLTDLKESDSAVYQCISTNKYGSVIEQAFVNVLTSKPIPLSDNVDTYMQVKGKSIEMKCLVFGSPPPVIVWRKEGSDVVIEDRYSLLEDKNLRIEKLTFDDAGSFSCVASNIYGVATVNQTLKVLENTIIQSFDSKTSYNVQRGNSVTLSVEVIADPALSPRPVTWKKSSVKVGRGDSFTIDDAKFSDKGTYVASVSTSLDDAKTYIRVTVQDVPEPPTNVEFTVNQDEPLNAMFTWVQPDDNFSPITAYKIEFENINSDTGEWYTLKDSLESTLTQANVELSPYVNYRFRMWAQNELGWSRTASDVTRTYETPISEPTLNPSGVTGMGTSPDNMVIYWNRIDELDKNGPSFEYKVSYCMKSPVCDSWESTTVNGSTTSYLITNTPTYTPYFITVQSVNGVGPGPTPTVFTGYSGEDVPLDAPTDVTVVTYSEGPTKATINWNGVSLDSVRGDLLGYTITYFVGGTTEAKAVNIFGDVTSGELTELMPYTKYGVNVAVYNSLAAGPTSDDVQLYTPEGEPGKPSKLRITFKSENKLTVSWDSPVTPNGVIKGYGVQYRCLDNPSVQPELINIPKTSITLADLTPEYRYVITVKAKTSFGFGEESIIQATTFGLREPDSSRINVTSGYNEVNVTWFPTDLGLDGKEFVVDYKKMGTDDWQGATVYNNKQTGLPVAVTGLEPGTTYYVRVIARNDYGEATPEILMVTTVGIEAATGSITSEIWFIVVICLLVLIVVVLIAICFLKRSKGGKYSVAEKEEQLMESQPINEDIGEYNVEKDNDVKQPLTPELNDNQNNGNPPTPLAGLQLTTPLRTRGDSVGGDSIDAFADADAKEFDEDGSFIGQYGTINESNHASAATSPGEVEMPEHLKGDAV